MPSFVNIGAYVGEGTMVDAWATVGSCAQIGKNVHLSGGVGIGGVLEPLQADPVIIGDGAFIGARAEVAEGVRVGEGAVLSMGVYLGASTKIIDRATGEVFAGEVPPYSVVVPGSIGGGDGKPALYCAVIVKPSTRRHEQDQHQRVAARLIPVGDSSTGSKSACTSVPHEILHWKR
jgi:2,3,4,5-tetrahydropyridine-2-carboxylate N-succinyltransferase